MAATRSAMVWGGGLFATLGLLLIVLRLIGAHGRLPFGDLASLPYFGGAAGLLVVGLILAVAAPPDRRSDRRVALEERPVHEAVTLRPKPQGTPMTHGLGATPSGPAPAKAAPAAETRPVWGSPRDAPATAAPRPALHPNDAATEDAPAAPRTHRAELLARLEELEQKANQAKVRYGLGKVSAAGYRQYLAEVDRERMMIESELMENED